MFDLSQDPYSGKTQMLNLVQLAPASSNSIFNGNQAHLPLAFVEPNYTDRDHRSEHDQQTIPDPLQFPDVKILKENFDLVKRNPWFACPESD